jgi:hypothetical protein
MTVTAPSTLAALRSVLRRPSLPLIAVVVAGIALRAWAWIAFSPAVLNLADSDTYLLYAHTSVFNDVVRPAGYPLFLKVLGWMSADPRLPILVQHLIGISTGLLAYALVLRLGAPRGIALAPAAFVLLSPDQVGLEHQYMPEALFTLLVVGSAYAATRGLVAAREAKGLAASAVAWLAAAGVLIGLAAYVRTVALAMGPFFALWVLLALPRPWARVRVAGAGVVLGAVVVLALGYATAHDVKSGYFGFTQYGGWASYIRTAQFADCTAFTPPAGTRRLCERTPSDARPGADFYAWEPGSPARRLFGPPPNGAAKLGAFGRAAILHQPLAYTETVFNDFLRFFAPSYNNDRPYAGPGVDVLDFDRRAPGQEAAIMRTIGRWYGPERLRIRDGWARAFQDLQQLLRVQGIVLAELLILAVAGLFVARAAIRPVIALLGAGGALLLLIPSATAVFNPRYGVPAVAVLAPAAALAAWSIWSWAVGRRA